MSSYPESFQVRLYVAFGNGALSKATMFIFCQAQQNLEALRLEEKKTDFAKIAGDVMKVIFRNHNIRNMRCNQRCFLIEFLWKNYLYDKREN